MLNRAARFFPILRELRTALPHSGTLLEVGSGAIGMAEFWSGRFVGCDLTFSSRPAKQMLALRCSGHQLPFGDQTFDAVVVSDVMEHVPPGLRKQVASEALRVCRKLAVIGYPCGTAAFALDQHLYQAYQERNRQPPQWLSEHMLHPFPDENLFSELPPGWQGHAIPNETLRFHDWLMRSEMFLPWDYSFRLALRIVPGLVERLLERANCEPAYRKIFVIKREVQSSYAW